MSRRKGQQPTRYRPRPLASLGETDARHSGTRSASPSLNRSFPPDALSSLRAAGLRVTPQRCAILQVLETSDHPLSVEAIRQRLAQHGSGIPTIYRNLQCFARLGWTEPILGPDQIMRFIRCHSDCHHHHIQCEACGRTVEVGHCGVEDILANLQCPSGFKITRHHLQLFGLCPECQK